MSADTTPISPARVAAALKDLSTSMLHLKVLEIRNSIAHLQYSNDQLKPFAEGSATALSSTSSAVPTDAATTTITTAATNSAEPDQDCIDAIRENEQVIDRMAERIALIRIEVEERGVSWTDFENMEVPNTRPGDAAATQGVPQKQVNGGEAVNGENGEQSSPWTDGTFQTGTISNGQVHFDSQPGRPTQSGGSLDDEQLRAALEERMRNLANDDEDKDESGGLHL